MESSKFGSSDRYDGTRILSWVSDLSGLSVDLVNFLFCQILALFLASLYRSILHPSKVSPAVRHAFALTVGLAFGYFCFGKQAIHIAALPAVCYIVIRTQSPAVVQRSVFLVAMTYLLCVHLVRQIYDYGSYTLDITGPLMIITQKVTSLAFSIHDGFMREHKDLTKAQQYHAVHKLPTTLEFFSYVLNFHCIMAGPLVFYKDYIDFVEGYNLLKSPSTNSNLDNGKTELILEPSPIKTVIRKVTASIVCAFIFMKFVKVYPVKNMKDDAFLRNTTMLYKFWYVMMATSCIRFKYYHAWLLADAICNNSGLGFSGYDKDGNAKWDLISNINVLGFEFASNMRDAINHWNCGTTRWLRTIVYERVPKKYGTTLTFALSAVWHGFYPGYYLTFATGALLVSSARVARRLFRHRFQQTQFTRMFYDILTCLTTRLVMGYSTLPFVLLEFMGSIRLYLRFYLCLHIAALIIIFVLPKFIRGNNRSISAVSSSDSISSAKAFKNIGLAAEEKTSTTVLDQKVLETLESDRNSDNIHETEINIGSREISTSSTYASKSKTSMSPSPSHSPAERIQLPTIACGREAVSVKHDQCEMEQLSNKLKEKIEAETKNIEEFIDKTVTETVSGIVEFKNDLMRDKSDKLFISQDGIRKRNTTMSAVVGVGVGDCSESSCVAKIGEETNAFLKKEIEVINAVVQQANVLPAVLSNGHAK